MAMASDGLNKLFQEEPTMIVKSDVPAVFRQAIAEGRLTNGQRDNAAFYMYMFTDTNGVDQFKHIDTRRYLAS